MKTAPSHSRRLVQATSLVMVFFVLSKVFGLVRDIVITHQFGTSRTYDAYLAAFRIPDIIFTVVAGGALGSAFIPPFAAMLANGETHKAWKLASHIINLVTLTTTAFAVVAALFADPIVAHVVAVGFTPDEQALTAHLMQLMLIAPIIFGVSGIVMGVLNSHHHFVLPALAPVLYNLGIIGGALFLAPALGPYGLAIGVVTGAALHLLVQVPWLVRARMQYAPSLGVNDPGVRQVLRLMLPRTAGIAAVQLNFLVNTILASTLPEGRLAALNIAFALILLPEGVVAQSIATVLFPTFAQQVARGEHDAMRRTFSTAFRIVLFMTIPASIGLILLGRPIIQLLYQRGAFDAESTAQTAWALQFFAVGLLAQSGLEIITRAFYALHDTATPVKVAVAAFVVNVALSLLLIGRLEQGGLALANSIATTAEMLLCLYLLRGRLGGVDGRRIAGSLVKILLAAAVMGLALLILLNTAAGLSAWLLAFAGIGLGGAVFILAMFLLRSDEIALAWRLARSRG
ncbi:MAG: murein biosynthesis integral membrane protein MurJ [Anaerolineae bacterium]